jgi:hypothetical protein
MDGKLPLDSPRWRSLESFGGDSSEIPALIRQLLQQADPADGEALAELQDRIYQQYSCTEAAYAVLPYLIEAATTRPPDQGVNLWILIGSIAATCQPSLDHPPQDLLPAFRLGISEAEPRCLQALLQGKWDLIRSYYLSLASIALAGHRLGKLFVDNLFPHAEANSTAICPKCRAQIEVAVFDTGLVVQDPQKPYPDPPAPGLPPEKPRRFQFTARSPNPWATVGRESRALIRARSDLAPVTPHLEAAASLAESGLTPDAPAALVFCLVGSLITLKGFPEPAVRYFHTCDSIACPNCGNRFIFAEHWWGLTR